MAKQSSFTNCPRYDDAVWGNEVDAYYNLT